MLSLSGPQIKKPYQPFSTIQGNYKYDSGNTQVRADSSDRFDCFQKEENGAEGQVEVEYYPKQYAQTLPSQHNPFIPPHQPGHHQDTRILSAESGIGLKRPYAAIDDTTNTLSPQCSTEDWFRYLHTDPNLSPQKLEAYRQTESEWRSISALLIPNDIQGTIPSFPVCRPTFQNFELLKHIIEQRTDMKLHILSARNKTHRKLEGFVKFSIKDDKPIINIYEPNPSCPADIRLRFQTLQHELIHALHYTNPAIKPHHKKRNFDDCFHQFEELIYKNMKANIEWSQLFTESAPLKDSMSVLSTQSLNAMKLNLMTEAIAYKLTCNLGRNTGFDFKMGQGYEAAIQFINHHIQASKTIKHQVKRQKISLH